MTICTPFIGDFFREGHLQEQYGWTGKIALITRPQISLSSDLSYSVTSRFDVVFLFAVLPESVWWGGSPKMWHSKGSGKDMLLGQLSKNILASLERNSAQSSSDRSSSDWVFRYAGVHYGADRSYRVQILHFWAWDVHQSHCSLNTQDQKNKTDSRSSRRCPLFLMPKPNLLRTHSIRAMSAPSGHGLPRRHEHLCCEPPETPSVHFKVWKMPFWATQKNGPETPCTSLSVHVLNCFCRKILREILREVFVNVLHTQNIKA